MGGCIVERVGGCIDGKVGAEAFPFFVSGGYFSPGPPSLLGTKNDCFLLKLAQISQYH